MGKDLKKIKRSNNCTKNSKTKCAVDNKKKPKIMDHIDDIINQVLAEEQPALPNIATSSVLPLICETNYSLGQNQFIGIGLSVQHDFDSVVKLQVNNDCIFIKSIDWRSIEQLLKNGQSEFFDFNWNQPSKVFEGIYNQISIRGIFAMDAVTQKLEEWLEVYDGQKTLHLSVNMVSEILELCDIIRANIDYLYQLAFSPTYKELVKHLSDFFVKMHINFDLLDEVHIQNFILYFSNFFPTNIGICFKECVKYYKSKIITDLLKLNKC